MKTDQAFRWCLVAALLGGAPLHAEESTDPSVAGLQKTANDFVAAYNDKDAPALAALFTENGEISDLTAEDLVTGREDITDHYKEIFAEDDAPSIAVEVASVRLVAPDLAIEDGTVHLTPPGEDEPPQSLRYTAVMRKNEAGTWQIASSRRLKDVTGAAGQLADLADALKGDWTSTTSDGVRLDLAFGWDSSGKFITGETLTTTSDGEPQEGSIRLGWNAARQSIVSWVFDAGGGSMQGIWTPSDDGWLVRAEGTTADGETITVNQELTVQDKNTLIWKATNRVVDGEKQPDSTLRIVRQTPDPGNDD